MNAEYQRLEGEASEVQQQINELVSSCSRMVAADFPKFEAKIAVLHQKLNGLRQGMGLLKLAGSAKMQKEAAALAKSQPKTFYSQGIRPKTVQLTGGVTVTLDVTYYHRSVSPEKAKNKKANRGMFPMLILLGIANVFTAGVRQRMMKCAALLGSYEEAVQMLADDGIKICVNTLRKVTAGMGEMQARLTKSGSVKVSGDATGRRIVVSTDGGRVRLREKRRGRTKKGHKRFKPAWREPRLFMIYATDDKRKIDPTFSPIIDGSLGSCDQLFRLLLSYLKALNVKDASKVLFIDDQTTWKNYFVNHGLTHRRMDYQLSVNGHLPIGGGAIESAVRRVINLRVKRNATSWLRENAETIIPEDIARLLHQRVTVTAALDHTRFQSSRTMSNSTFGDPFQEFIAFLPQGLPRHQPACMHGPAGEHELTGTCETDRARFLFAAHGARGYRQSNQIVGQDRRAKFDRNHFRRLAANVAQIQRILDHSDI